MSRESCAKELGSGRFYFHGTDLQGRPVAYLTMRGHDPKSRDLEAVLRAMVYVCEQLVASLPPKEFQVRRRSPPSLPPKLSVEET